MFDFLQKGMSDLWSQRAPDMKAGGASRPPPRGVPAQLVSEPDDVARPSRKPVEAAEWDGFHADAANDAKLASENRGKREAAEAADAGTKMTNHDRGWELYEANQEAGLGLTPDQLTAAMDMPKPDMSELDQLTKVNGLEQRRHGISDKWNAAAGMMAEVPSGREGLENLMNHAKGEEGTGSGMPLIGDSTTFGKGVLGAFSHVSQLVHLLVGDDRSTEDVAGTAVHEAYHAKNSAAQTAVPDQQQDEDHDDYSARKKEAELIHEGRARVAGMLFHDEHMKRIDEGGEGNADAHHAGMDGQTLTEPGKENVAHSTYFRELAAEQARLAEKDPSMSKEKIAAMAKEHAEIAAAKTMIPRLLKAGY